MSNPFELLTDDPVTFNLLIIKSKLCMIIKKMIDDRGLSQAAAAEVLGISQPRVSNLIRGRLDKFSNDMLLELLFKMGYKLDMDFTPFNEQEPLKITLKKAVL
ncbi:MAG: helix-turn-helix domain-containing protein [Plesiomonas shigelloides]